MSKIEWTDQTWNPTTGCNKISQGCKNCYAEVMHKRMMQMHPAKYSKPFTAGVQTHQDELTKPLSWKKPRMVFVNSMSDLFHEDVSFLFIDAVFSVMADVRHHIYQVLTKRPDIMLKFFEWKKQRLGIPWQPSTNVWLGVSVENQENADWRIPFLLQIPATVRFLSCEPLLGHLDLSSINHLYRIKGQLHASMWYDLIHWVIAGGESGHKARPMHPDWVRSLRAQCQAADIPFFFKQWGLWAPGSHIDLHRNIVLTKEGEQFNYNFYRAAAREKYTVEEWNNLLPVTMHRDTSNKKNHTLDGNTHNEFPKQEALCT